MFRVITFRPIHDVTIGVLTTSIVEFTTLLHPMAVERNVLGFDFEFCTRDKRAKQTDKNDNNHPRCRTLVLMTSTRRIPMGLADEPLRDIRAMIIIAIAETHDVYATKVWYFNGQRRTEFLQSFFSFYRFRSPPLYRVRSSNVIVKTTERASDVTAALKIATVIRILIEGRR